ncbi:peamaclein-like [Melia azedarach]|uniref:Peamaclein-like n=1 Tax=Melia azedarach TaxID=155640 RepID=A0ACC1Y0Z0_MELAZ|nr:peamaclein-like [Melia azedarach]
MKMKLFFATLLLCSLLFSSSFLEPAMAQTDSSFCGGKCAKRCEQSRSSGPLLEVLRHMLRGVQVCSFWDLWEQT